MKKVELTQDVVRELLNYDPETGALTWRERGNHWFSTDRDAAAWNTRFAGKPAGIVSNKYLRLTITGRQCLGHRIAWLYVTGELPKNDIDHKDCDGSNNRWGNLREATKRQNQRNKSKIYNSSTGAKGAQIDRTRNCYKSTIRTEHGPVFLGRFSTIDEAAAAYAKAAKQYHGDFARPA